MFKDINFKLAVISALMEEGHFEKEAKKLKAAHLSTAEAYVPIKEVMAYYESLTLSEKLLATVTTLSPDGGDLAYVYAMSEWDGEDDTFEIHSLEGIEQLVNLEEFTPISMMGNGVDYTPILACKKLKNVDMTYAKDDKANKAVKAALEKRGVEIED